MTREEIEKKISKNREEIHRALESNLPLQDLYALVRMLSSQNERLIEKLKTLSNGN